MVKFPRREGLEHSMIVSLYQQIIVIFIKHIRINHIFLQRRIFYMYHWIIPSRSASPHKRHVGCKDRHIESIGLERQGGHGVHGVGSVRGKELRLNHATSVGLQRSSARLLSNGADCRYDIAEIDSVWGRKGTKNARAKVKLYLCQEYIVLRSSLHSLANRNVVRPTLQR